MTTADRDPRADARTSRCCTTCENPAARLRPTTAPWTRAAPARTLNTVSIWPALRFAFLYSCAAASSSHTVTVSSIACIRYASFASDSPAARSSRGGDRGSRGCVQRSTKKARSPPNVDSALLMVNTVRVGGRSSRRRVCWRRCAVCH